MIYPLFVLATDAKGDRAPDVIHDRLNVCFHLTRGDIQADGLVAASDIVTDAGRIQLVTIGDYATDGNGIAQMVVGHQGDRLGFAGTVERWSPSDPTELAAELQTRLEAGDVSAVLGLSSSSGRAVRRAVYRSELEISAATFGWSRSIAELVADGRLMFAILDHPELQSYLAAVGALVVERLRLDPAGYFNGAQLLIGPKVVGAEEMQTLLDSLVRQETQP